MRKVILNIWFQKVGGLKFRGEFRNLNCDLTRGKCWLTLAQ